jgi:hypothetical protein
LDLTVVKSALLTSLVVQFSKGNKKLKRYELW